MEIDDICDEFVEVNKSKSPDVFCQDWKKKNLYPIFDSLVKYSQENCNYFDNITNGLFDNSKWYGNVNDIPFIPVRLFKSLELRNNDEYFRQLTSSGTSGANVSKIYVDRKTAQRQTKVLVALTGSVIGAARRPMIIFDNSQTRQSRDAFSARAAGIGGFSNFGRRPHYALSPDLRFNMSDTFDYILENKDKNILGFGFTYLVWQSAICELVDRGLKLNMGAGSALIHGGGWKKLEHLNIPRSKFNDEAAKVLGFEQIFNYYGMVEQVGSIFFECKEGHFHAPFTSEVIIRCPLTFRELPNGEVGLIQLLSMVPTSYPGNSLLTEDLGICFGEDDCSCGLPGRHFAVLGRKENAEIRGCSDVL